MKTSVTAHLGAALLLLLLLGPVQAAETAPLSNADRDLIVSAVVQHFRDHPEQLVEAIMGWRAKSETPDLVTANDPISGNPNGDVTIIEFIDMGCSPCKTMSERIGAVAAADKNIRFVHKDYPVTGTDAVYAARQLLTAFFTDDSRNEMAKMLTASSNLDVDLVKNASAANIHGPVTQIVLDRVNHSLEQNRKLASHLGIKELPAVVMMSGKEIDAFSGMRTEAEIAASVATLRKKSLRPD